MQSVTTTTNQINEVVNAYTAEPRRLYHLDVRSIHLTRTQTDRRLVCSRPDARISFRFKDYRVSAAKTGGRRFKAHSRTSSVSAFSS